MYKSLKEFYDSAEFFPVGRIVPRRILKVERKLSHRFKFASDTWFIRMPKGHLLVSDNMRPNSQGCVIRAHGDFNKKKTLKVKNVSLCCGWRNLPYVDWEFCDQSPHSRPLRVGSQTTGTYQQGRQDVFLN